METDLEIDMNIEKGNPGLFLMGPMDKWDPNDTSFQ